MCVCICIYVSFFLFVCLFYSGLFVVLFGHLFLKGEGKNPYSWMNVMMEGRERKGRKENCDQNELYGKRILN